MKKITKAIALLLSIVLILTACDINITDTNSTNSSSSTPSTNENSNITETSLHETGDNFVVTATYPYTNHERVDQIISQEIKKISRDFSRQVKILSVKNDVEATLNINYDSYSYSDSVISVLYNIESKIDGSVLTSNFARTYNLDSDSMYCLADILDETSIGKMKKILKEKIGDDDSANNSDAIDKDTNSENNLLDSFILFENKIEFVFPIYQVGNKSIKIDVETSAIGSDIKLDSPSITQFAQVESSINLSFKADVNGDDTDNSATSTKPSTDKPTSAKPTTPSSQSKSKKVALTFDDGPGPYTNKLLDCLKEYNAKATFFMLGSKVKCYPDTVKRIYNEGHELGNHTYDHVKLTTASDKTIKYQVNSVVDLVEEITGHKPTVFRAPGGSVNDHVRSFIDVPIMHWNVDTLDWKYRDTKKVYNLVIEKVAPGDIILLHDIHQTSVEAALLIIEELTRQGYELVIITELFDEYGPKLENGKSYHAVTGSTWK